MKKSYRGWGFYISLIVVVVLVWFLLDGQHLNQDDYNYAQFKQELADDEIKSVEVQPNRVYPTGRLDIVKTDKSEETLYVLDVSEAQSLMDKEKFTSYVVNDIPAENWLMNLLPLLLVFGAMFILFMIVMNNQAAGGGGGSKMMNFGKSRAKMTTDENRNVTFENVAGLREEKEELEEIVDFLKEPRKYTRLGARIPKGVLLVGPPGTGKTSIARSVARALDKKYVRICLGGVKDEAEIRGHRRTYVGAMPGRLIQGIRQAGVKNPLMLLDEIDKMSSDYKGDPSSAMLEVLDSEQNAKFIDHYVDMPVDLSEVLFIATANDVHTIPRPLLDRMELIEVSSYTENEKMHIAKEHLLGKQIEKNGLEPEQLTITDEAMHQIISGYTREAGVRNLERKIGEICRKAAREIYEGTCESVFVDEKQLEQYLGKERFHVDRINDQDEIGIVRGLAWTSVGGDTLQIEVNVMPGKGEFKLTGQLGDVMKESAQAGISYIRSVGASYDIPEDFFTKHDIHIHIPEGAVPKDGPSAGITMATAMLSAITKKPVRADVAMTGEITLRGRVLPIGGLKEKLLAAKTAGIRTVCVPAQNKADIAEISEEIREGLQICYVKKMEEVLKIAMNGGTNDH